MLSLARASQANRGAELGLSTIWGGGKLSHVSSWQAIIDAAVPSRRAWTLAGRDRHHVARNAAVVAPKRRWAASSPKEEQAVGGGSAGGHGGGDGVGWGGLRGLAALLRG